MSDDPVRTIVETQAGRRSFQEYLVRDRARESVRAIRYSGCPRRARSAEGVIAAIEQASLASDRAEQSLREHRTILAVPGIRQALRRADGSGDRRVAAHRRTHRQGSRRPHDARARASPSTAGLARIYGDFLDGMVIDKADQAYAACLRDDGLGVAVLDTLMRPPPVRSTAVARAPCSSSARQSSRTRLLAS